MKRVLIDSHILIWLLYCPDRIPASVKNTLLSQDKVLVSVVSLWELAIKFKIGKLQHSPNELLEGVKKSNIGIINLDSQHVERMVDIVLPHNDPFDTMLIAQATTEGIALVTADKQLLDTNYLTIDSSTRR